MLKKLIKYILYYLPTVKKRKILIIEQTPYSGSNALQFYKYLTKTIRYDDVSIINISKSKSEGIFAKLIMTKKIYQSEIIIATHPFPKYNKYQKLIQVFHGIPLKSMGLFDNEICETWRYNDKVYFDKADILITTSETDNTLLNATIGQTINKYRVLGFPRNDLLFNVDKCILESLLGYSLNNKKIVTFVPTFKNGYLNRMEGNSRQDNIFGFDKFDPIKFNKFLIDNNIIFIAKLHPFEEKYYKDKFKKVTNSNFLFLSNELLEKYDVDLYEILGGIDLLITDYSSIYFDFLLSQKPILFVNPDIDKYRKTRGFLLYPYEFWAPGPKANNQTLMQSEILKLLNDHEYYNKERKTIMNIIHLYKDNKSCERLWDFINENYLK